MLPLKGLALFLGAAVVIGALALRPDAKLNPMVGARTSMTVSRPSGAKADPKAAVLVGSQEPVASLGVEEPSTVRSAEVVPVEIAPQILDLQPTSVRFSWVTIEASVGKLELVGPDGPIQAEEVAATRHHRIDVARLTPKATYAYMIDGRFQGRFVTPAIDEPFTFAVFGHPGGTNSPHAHPSTFLANTLKGLAPDFLLCTGDVCYFTAEHSFKKLYFDVFRDILGERPIYLTAANHEAGFPSSQGTGYGMFRTLFPYDFPSETHGFHSFRRGNIEFFAYAYGPMKAEQAKEQMDWLGRSLRESRAEFRIVYLGGGQNPTHFQRNLFFKTAREGGADLVFGGDGVGSRVEKVDGVDFFFAGTEEPNPASLFYVRAEPYSLQVSRYDSTMQTLKGAWDFESRRPKIQVFDAKPLMEQGAVNASVHFTPIGLKSTDFHGVKLVIHNPLKIRVPYWLRWSTASTTGGGDYFFRSDTRYLAPGETRTNYFHLPAANPVKRTPWILKELDVRLWGPRIPKGLDIGPWIEELTVFRDPLLEE